MRSLFRRAGAHRGPDLSGLGGALLAVPAPAGTCVPAGCVGLVFDQRGNLRRVAGGQRLQFGAAESGRIFHPGPYAFDVAPYESAPETGLRFELAIDSPDPRVIQQRFDLFLVSEAPERLELGMLRAAVEAALQRELSQDRLFLPPCTTLDEWNAFRLGVNQLIYTRFGMIVDDCVPVDLGAQVDFAARLSARAEPAAQAPASATQWARRAVAALHLHDGEESGDMADARALRRLFLELPCVMSGLRLALPDAQVPFTEQQALLARLDRAALAVDTMPAFALAAPAEPLAASGRARRAAASLAALEALDEAWALLARLRSGSASGAADEADRIVSNLECALAGRRLSRVAEAEEA
ncbi:hypothetical protein [Pseudoduganella sp. GCM10020061]|uniref:hypothetical protein n=1 Tax=Pseudoduganella sp. GCM10020061 TaxID=3317345 RepID=UPI0036440012